jgi:hypothetical protein
VGNAQGSQPEVPPLHLGQSPYTYARRQRPVDTIITRSLPAGAAAAPPIMQHTRSMQSNIPRDNKSHCSGQMHDRTQRVLAWLHVQTQWACVQAALGTASQNSPLCSMRSADRVCRAIDKDMRHLRIPDGAHPAILALHPLRHVFNKPACR